METAVVGQSLVVQRLILALLCNGNVLPEAQMDRFLMKVIIDYPEDKAELDIIAALGLMPGCRDVTSFAFAGARL